MCEIANRKKAEEMANALKFCQDNNINFCKGNEPRKVFYDDSGKFKKVTFVGGAQCIIKKGEKIFTLG